MSSPKKSSGKIFVVSSPSGCGKTTIVKNIIKNIGEKLSISVVVTYTTRKVRPGEVHGRDYFFITHEYFNNINVKF